MYHRQSLDCFELDQQLVFDDQIGTETLFDFQSGIGYWNDFLSFDRKSFFHQEMGQHRLICGLEHSWAKFLVNLKAAIDSDGRQPFNVHRNLLRDSSLLRALRVKSIQSFSNRAAWAAW